MLVPKPEHSQSTTVYKELIQQHAEVPRPEYPRPQFVRPEWLNLNGVWNFAIDDQNVGLEERWFERTSLLDRILVPFSCESGKSGIGDKAFHPCVWYQRSFRVPEAWQGQKVLLHFGAVDYRATVWVNGIAVAWHQGGHTPFHCDITSQLKLGDNMIVVRAEDPPTDRYIPRGKQHWETEPVYIFYTRTTGIWQTVWLEPIPSSYIEKIRITPHLSGEVDVTANICGCIESQYVTVTVHKDGQICGTGTGICEGPRAHITLRIENPELWSPESPTLYGVTLELHTPAGPEPDRVESYIGFRSISREGGRIHLNGKPYYLKTVLDQGYWPESNLTPPSDEAIRADILMAKDLGFNGVRKHQKAEDPRFLYWADQLGLLVSAEMANAYLFDESAVERTTREWIEVIERDYNHPSIVIWVPVNESWGVPNLANRQQQAHLKALYYLTKSLDDTRLVIDNDGWEHTEVTDLFAIHDYTETGDVFYDRYQKAAEQGVPLPLYGKLYLAPGYTYNGAPILLSEFGGIGYVLPEDSKKIPANSWGYSGIEPTERDALTRMEGLYQAISRLPQIAGICYTQLYDVEQEINGIMTYDRRLKFDPEQIRRINSLLK